MSKLIIVCGLPGAGKTTLANELSKKLKIACIHKDSIKERLYESLGCSSLEDSKRIGKPSVNIMLHLTKEQLENGVDVMIEAPFNFTEDHILFEEWKKEYDVDLYSIICYIDPVERKKRFQERERHHSHHDTDRQHITSMGTPEYEYDYSEIPGKHIRINTDKPVNELVDEIIEKIK